MIARWLPWLAASALVASTASTAAAQSSPPAPGAPVTAKAAAQESYARGNRLFNQAEQKHDRSLYEGAYLQFSQAYSIFPDDKILWNLLVAEIKTERYVDGLRHLRAYDKHQHVSERPQHADHRLFAALLDQASKATGRISVEAPAGARVRLDDVEVGVAPLAEPLDVTPGAHKVEAVLVSGKTLPGSVTVGAGESTRASLAEPVVEAPTVAQPAPGSNATAGVGVGNPVAPSEGPAASGSWWTGGRELAVVFGGVAVAGLVVGAISTAAASSNNNSAASLRASLGDTSQCSQCAELSDKISAAHRDTTIGTVGFVVAGVGALGAAGAFVLGVRHTAAQAGSVRWTPTIGPGAVGMVGSF